MTNDNLHRLFNPRTVALIGASNKPGRVGHDVMQNLLNSGFEGTVFPVNPKRSSVQSVKAYSSLAKIPDPVDLAIVATPAPTVPDVVKEAARLGIGGMVVITAGFKEAGEEGRKMFGEIQRTAKKAGIRLIGPNCLGFLRPNINLNASFSSKMALPGSIAFVSQSGALCTAVLDWANANNVGFSHFVSLGSMADISFSDLIQYLEEDEETRGIVIYMESLADARRFVRQARAFTRKKPIFALKVGRSSQGAQAAMSHTGSLAGNDKTFDVAFTSSGVVRVDDSYDILGCAQLLAKQERPQGNRLAVITNAGGPGVIATDSIVQQGARIAELSSQSIEKLNQALPAHWSHGNPVDVLGDAGPARYRTAIDVCLKDRHVDGVLVILTAQSMTDPESVARELVDLSQKRKTPVMACWMGESDVACGRRVLERGGVPLFEFPECAVRSFYNLYRSHELARSMPAIPSLNAHPKKSQARRVINEVRRDNRSALTEAEAKRVLSLYGISLAPHAIARTADEAARTAEKLGFPVVMKILSADIMHKTDVGGVKAHITNAEEAREAFNTIHSTARTHAPSARLQGVFIEQMVSHEQELLIGSQKDATFGSTIMFGLGGTAVEVFGDTNMALPPLDKNSARKLMQGTQVFKLLAGHRGSKAANLRELEDILCNVSQLICDFPEIQELDINPLAVSRKQSAVLDAKIVLGEPQGAHIVLNE